MRSNRRQIRPIVGFDRPVRAAIDVRDQCVAFVGFSSSVATSTSSTLSSRIDGGRPGLGSSTKPSSRIRANRPRHLFTVLRATPRSAATWALGTPGSVQANTIRDRNARACDDLARRDQRTS